LEISRERGYQKPIEGRSWGKAETPLEGELIIWGQRNMLLKTSAKNLRLMQL